MYSKLLCVSLYILSIKISRQTQCLDVKMNPNDEIRKSLGQCVLQGCRRYFTSNFETVTYQLPPMKAEKDDVSLNNLNEIVLSSLQAEERVSFLVENLDAPREAKWKYTGKSDSYIIQLRTENESNKNIERLKSFAWNPHAKFLVLSTTVFSDPRDVALKVIRTLWGHNIVNVVVLLADSNNITAFNVYTWGPYSLHNCGNDFSDIVAVDSCSYGVSQKSVSWFRSKIPKKLFKCPVKVKFYPMPPHVMPLKPITQVSHYDADLGIDINILNMIASILNLTMAYEKSSFDTWGTVDENYSTTRDLTLLKEDKIDLVTGGYTKTVERVVFFDFIRTNVQESLVWCVPHAPILSRNRHFLDILTPEIWLLTSFLYLLISICMWYTSILEQDEYKGFKNLLNCLMCNFLVLIGLAPNTLPRTVKVRYFFSVYIIFSFYLDLLYGGYLTSILSSPHYKEKYGSLQDIYNHKLHTYFIPGSKKLFENLASQQSDKLLLKTIRRKWLNCNQVPDCLNIVIASKDSAFCVPRLYKDYLLNNKFKENGSEIYCFKESVLILPLAIFMRKGFPLFRSFDDTMTKIIEAGFVDKWTKDIVRTKFEKQVYNPPEVQRFRLNNLLTVFYMMTLGHVVATVVFAAEFAIYNFHLCKSN